MTDDAMTDAIEENRRVLVEVVRILGIHGKLLGDIHAAVTKEAPAETDSLGDILRALLAIGEANNGMLVELVERER